MRPPHWLRAQKQKRTKEIIRNQKAFACSTHWGDIVAHPRTHRRPPRPCLQQPRAGATHVPAPVESLLWEAAQLRGKEQFSRFAVTWRESRHVKFVRESHKHMISLLHGAQQRTCQFPVQTRTEPGSAGLGHSGRTLALSWLHGGWGEAVSSVRRDYHAIVKRNSQKLLGIHEMVLGKPNDQYRLNKP